MTSPDPTWTTTSLYADSLLLLGDTWVRVSAIEAIQPSAAYPEKSRIQLRSGQHLYVKMTVDEVVESLKAARKK